MTAFHPFFIAFGFLTRIPIKIGVVDSRAMRRSVAYYPIVGLFLGSLLAGASYLNHATLSPNCLSVLLVAFLALMTGGLHLDGWADFFDGMGGGNDRERVLAIMRDSRIGSYGTVALTLLLLAKTFALIPLIENGNFAALVVFPAIARWTAVPLVVCFPYARKEGLGTVFQGESRTTEIALATFFIVATLIFVSPSYTFPSFISLAFIVLLTVLLFGYWNLRRLGGLTGDIYGAAIELAELLLLLLAGQIG